MSRIKIISGWSAEGGSTVANINLTNALNDRGHKAVFYGPHDWHLDQCESGALGDFRPAEDDIILSHFLHHAERPNCAKFVLTCHETNLYPISQIPYGLYDFIHYVSLSQREWHNVEHPNVIIPNVLNQLGVRFDGVERNAVGIIGSIDRHKRTHLAVKEALDAEKDKVKILIFGSKTDPEYWDKEMLPLFKDDRVVYMGHCDDPQEMYGQIDGVYHASIRETFNYVRAECSQVRIPYHGLESATPDVEYISERGVMEMWEDALGLQAKEDFVNV